VTWRSERRVNKLPKVVTYRRVAGGNRTGDLCLQFCARRLLSGRVSAHFSARRPKDRQIMLATFRPCARRSAAAVATETTRETAADRERGTGERAKSPPRPIYNSQSIVVCLPYSFHARSPALRPPRGAAPACNVTSVDARAPTRPPEACGCDKKSRPLSDRGAAVPTRTAS